MIRNDLLLRCCSATRHTPFYRSCNPTGALFEHFLRDISRHVTYILHDVPEVSRDPGRQRQPLRGKGVRIIAGSREHMKNGGKSAAIAARWAWNLISVQEKFERALKTIQRPEWILTSNTSATPLEKVLPLKTILQLLKFIIVSVSYVSGYYQAYIKDRPKYVCMYVCVASDPCDILPTLMYFLNARYACL